MRVVTTNVYMFNELSEPAKSNAISDFKTYDSGDYACDEVETDEGIIQQINLSGWEFYFDGTLHFP